MRVLEVAGVKKRASVTGVAVSICKIPAWQALAMATVLAAPTVHAASEAEQVMTQQSEQLIAKFANSLKNELSYIMRKSGPVAAIDVCKEKAPLISAQLSRESGAAITRISNRYRNPLNMPNDWQANVLARFAKQAAANASAIPTYYNETGTGKVHYMEAIKTGGLCLTCHGKAVSEKVQAALNKDYPYDMAQGYDAGELRGAFSVIWQLRPPKDLEAMNAAMPYTNLITAGQPSEADLQRLQKEGVKTVINLRTEQEMSFAEGDAVKALGMEYVNIPVDGATGITKANAMRLQAALQAATGKVFLHCASSNRVGALVALNAHQQGKPVELAIAQGKAAGLQSLEAMVRRQLMIGK